MDWRNWTFFNWLAVLAFILALVGFLNSVLSLRSRFKDWRGVRSKKAFENRLDELKYLINKTGEYRTNWPAYYAIVIYDASRVLYYFILSMAAFASTTISSLNPVLFTIKAFDILIGVACAFMLGSTIARASLLLRKTKYVAKPGLLVNEVTKFMVSGAKNNLLTYEVHKDMLDTLVANKLMSTSEYNKIEAIIEKLSLEMMKS